MTGPVNACADGKGALPVFPEPGAGAPPRTNSACFSIRAAANRVDAFLVGTITQLGTVYPVFPLFTHSANAAELDLAYP